MKEALLIAGLIILILNFLDFFYTTISGNGFWKLSTILNEGLAKLILKNGSNIAFNYSGFAHLFTNVFLWLFFLILGVFLIFLSGPEMVLHETTRAPASAIERFYFVCYLIATLGTGEFVPGNTLSNIFSAIFAFSGFILLTTALTYLISVNNSVLKKKELALYISGLGENIAELYRYFTVSPDLDTLISRSDAIQNLINNNTSNSLTFPVIRYFLTGNKKHSLILQLAKLYEVLNILRKDFEKNTVQHKEINSCMHAIEYYLELHENAPLNFSHNPERLREYREFWRKYQRTYEGDERRDAIMATALKKAGWSWEDVYISP